MQETGESVLCFNKLSINNKDMIRVLNIKLL